MIEVEKQFKPTDEQISAIVRDSEFKGEKIDHDIYYDYQDYSLFKQDVRLRYRNDSYQLKIESSSGVDQEIEEKEKIASYFKVTDLDAFVKEQLVAIIEYKGLRKKYQNGDFTIMIDEMDFGFKICEIELMVEQEEDVHRAEERIKEFAEKYGISLEKIKSKRREYFRIMKPEVYKELYS